VEPSLGRAIIPYEECVIHNSIDTLRSNKAPLSENPVQVQVLDLKVHGQIIL